MPEERVLNKEQKQAVEYGNGPLLIIAGAGTGKTTVVTERIKHLIIQKKVSPSAILALTFTEKAALEMQTRVDQVLPLGFGSLWISTFHSFAERILQDEALSIGLDPKYKLLSQAEAVQFFRLHLFDFDLTYFRPLGNPTKFVEAILQHFDRLRDEDISPTQYLTWINNQKPKNPEDKDQLAQYLELAKAFEKYQHLKQTQGLADFSDLISNVLLLFRTRPNILKKYQQKFKHILVDEYQDTNFSQNQLVRLLAGTKPNLTVVADDDQSIYRFRGAAVSNVIDFTKTYSKTKIVVLTKNYRSNQKILDSSYQLIKNNNPDRLEVKEGIDKKLVSVKDKKPENQKVVEFLLAENGEKEAEMVINQILIEKEKNQGFDWQDFAILVRANNHAEPFLRQLNQKGIPFQFLGPAALYKQPEIKDLIAYLSILVNFQDNVAMYRILSMDIFSLAGRDLAGIINFAKNNNLSLFEACEQVEKIIVSDQGENKIKQITSMLNRHLDLVKNQSAGQILYFFLQETGLLKAFLDLKSEEDEKKAQNIAKFFDKLRSFESSHEEASVFSILDFINLSLELGESPQVSENDWSANNAINVLTVHSAKGLEFSVVFLVNLVERRFPTTQRREALPIPDQLVKELLPQGDFHLQEERRLFYVGMTRAKDKLFLTAANYYNEGKQKKKISPFVTEVLGDQPTEKENKEEPNNQLSVFDFQPSKKIKTKEAFSRPPITFLSYSQLDTFSTCPLQYKFRYILRIPTPPSAALSFGDSIHQTMKDFYQKALAGENPNKEDLLKILKQNWSALGYPSKAHEEKYQKQGEKILSEFFDKSYDPKKLPLALEQVFSVKLSPSLKAGGKIDRIDRAKSDSNEIEIIDYKTGKSSTKKDLEKDLQLTLYALAATDGTLTYMGLLEKTPSSEQVKISFYFFETQEKISTFRKTEDIQNLKQELLQKAQDISQSDFSPTPGKYCDFCDYKLLCEAWS